MKKYMILCSTWCVQYGKHDCTLINFAEQKNFSLKGKQYQVFAAWHKGNAIYTETLDTTETALMTLLKEQQIATFEDKFFIRQTADAGRKMMLYQEKKSKLFRVFVELPAEENTIFPHGMTSPCWVCRNQGKLQDADAALYTKMIESLAKQSCEQVVMFGGDILNAPQAEGWMQTAEENYIQLIMLTNAAMLTPQALALAAKHDTILVVTVDFTEQVDMEACKRLMQTLQTADVQAKFSIVISQKTIDAYPAAEAAMQEEGAEIVNVSLLMEESISESELKEICLSNPSVQEYKYLTNMNSCLAGTLAVDSQLNVLPCPEMRKQKLGQIETKEDTLVFVKNANALPLSNFWLNCKDLLPSCAECSRRHLCMDCRAAEAAYCSNGDNPYAKRKCEYFESCAAADNRSRA